MLITNTKNSFSNFWRYKELFWSLFWTYLKLRHVGSILGFIWTLINPVLFIAIYWLVFSQIIRMDLSYYPLFLIPGYLAWNFSFGAIINSSNLISDNKYLITKIAFPNEIIIFSNVAVYFFDFIIAFIIYLFILFFFLPIQLNLIVYLPIIIIVQVLFTIGISLLVSCISVYFKDISQITVLLGNIFFFLTPIFYPLEFIKGKLRILLLLNPMTSIVTIYHDILYYQKNPSVNMLLIIGIFSVFLFFSGYMVFNKYKYQFAELS